MDRINLQQACAGDIVSFSGLEDLRISDTLCAVDTPEALPAIAVEEPTVSITIQVNDSPFSGRDGNLLTSRQISDRLDKELLHNLALSVEPTENLDKFKISGCGELHLSILIENMRREGFEMGVSKPEVIFKTVDGKKTRSLRTPYGRCAE